MTISHFDKPPPGLLSAFLDIRQNWHPGEVGTLTGYDQSEYEELGNSREKSDDSEATAMLRQAANALLGYPSTSIEACTEHLGANWADQLRVFLDRTEDGERLT